VSILTAAEKKPYNDQYMKDKELMQKLNMIMQMGQQNQGMQQQILMQMIQQDQRLMELFMAMQGIDMGTMRPEDFSESSETAPPPKRPDPPKKEEPPPPEDNRTPEQKEADECKTKGNDLYKKKEFAEALTWYDKAIEKQPNDLVYYNNKCAVWIEMGEQYYDKVLETCKDLIERRYEINTANPGGASFEKVAKVYNRKAAVYEKRKQFDQAIEMLQKALCESREQQQEAFRQVKSLTHAMLQTCSQPTPGAAVQGTTSASVRERCTVHWAQCSLARVSSKRRMAEPHTGSSSKRSSPGSTGAK